VILSLLLIVTFIANYLSTTLPNTMGQNDVQHEVQVQNQVAQLAALLQETAESGSVGAQVSQPVTLGSAGSPPFAGQDASMIAPGNLSGGLGFNFTLNGPAVYNFPSGGTANRGNNGGCSFTPVIGPPYTGVTCGTSSHVTYNFSASTPTAYSIASTVAGTYSFNVTDLGPATITVSTSASSALSLLVLGSNLTVSLSNTGTGAKSLFEIVGSNDTLNVVTNTATSTVGVYAVGYHNVVNLVSASAAITFAATFYGADDSFTIAAGAPGHTGNLFTVVFNGMGPTGVTSSCPVDNLAASTDTVSGGVAADGTYSVTYNDTAASNPTVSSPWVRTLSTAVGLCAFFAPSVVPVSNGFQPPSASLVVELRNTYAPTAEVALDQGAVVYAQAGAIPVFIVPPPISYVSGVLSVFLPRFSGTIGTEAGSGTADVLLRLLSVQQIQVPSSGFSLANSTTVTMTVVSPYAAAWYAYFLSVPSLASYVTCSPAGASSPCTALYQPGYSLGKVTVTVPASSSLTLDFLVGLYSIGLD